MPPPRSPVRQRSALTTGGILRVYQSLHHPGRDLCSLRAQFVTVEGVEGVEGCFRSSFSCGDIPGYHPYFGEGAVLAPFFCSHTRCENNPPHLPHPPLFLAKEEE